MRSKKCRIYTEKDNSQTHQAPKSIGESSDSGTIEPILSSVWYAERLSCVARTAHRACLCYAACRDHTVHIGHVFAQATSVIAQLKPVHCTGVQHTLVRVRWGLDTSGLGAAEEQTSRVCTTGEVKGRAGLGVKVVDPKVLGVDPLAIEGEVGDGVGERVARVSLVR